MIILPKGAETQGAVAHSNIKRLGTPSSSAAATRVSADGETFPAIDGVSFLVLGFDEEEHIKQVVCVPKRKHEGFPRSDAPGAATGPKLSHQ